MRDRQMAYLILLLFMFISNSAQQGVLEGIFNFLSEGQQQMDDEPRDEPFLLPEYDFIVVGAGTAGCVVTNRLTENPDWKVLLIEAGGPENLLMDFPLLANYLQFTTANWRYNTMPSDRYCMAMDNNQCNWPRGKVVGGSSVLNYMIYTRGNKRDYDHWAELGNVGWSYKDVFPYFMKIENFTIDELYDPKWHNKDGYLNVGYVPYHTKLAETIVEANNEMGVPTVDYNAKTQTGVSMLQVTLKDGMRHSSSRAYLHPIKNRKNLHLAKFTMVTRVLIDPKTKKTYGVEIARNGRRYMIKASKEVILSGGSINSPQLLMLSGIGPKKHLQSLNIPVIKNSRVGFNLMDHVSVGGLTFMIDKPYSLKTDDAFAGNHLQDYLNHHQGAISIPGGCEVLSFHDVIDPKNPDGYPQIELLYVAGSLASDMLLRKDFGIRDSIYDSMFKSIENDNSFMILPMLMRPKSKGRVLLSSANYKSKPLIFPNYFANDDDLKTIVKGIRIAMDVCRQPAMRKIGCKLHDVPIPDCAGRPFDSDEYLECMARHFSFTIYHLSGTCKMGPADDKKAVVDPRLRVYGVKGLRVIDASIMPEVMTGHTNAPVFMIAEKGADMIKQDWGFI